MLSPKDLSKIDLRSAPECTVEIWKVTAELLDIGYDHIDERSYAQIRFPIMPFPLEYVHKVIRDPNDPASLLKPLQYVPYWYSLPIERVVKGRIEAIYFLARLGAVKIIEDPAKKYKDGRFSGDCFVLNPVRGELLMFYEYVEPLALKYEGLLQSHYTQQQSKVTHNNGVITYGLVSYNPSDQGLRAIIKELWKTRQVVNEDGTVIESNKAPTLSAFISNLTPERKDKEKVKKQILDLNSQFAKKGIPIKLTAQKQRVQLTITQRDQVVSHFFGFLK